MRRFCEGCAPNATPFPLMTMLMLAGRACALAGPHGGGVLDEGDEGGRLEVEARRAAALGLVRVTLALKQIAVLRGGDELLRIAVVILVIGLVASGQGHHGGVVEIIVPERVEAMAAALRGAHQP